MVHFSTEAQRTFNETSTHFNALDIASVMYYLCNRNQEARRLPLTLQQTIILILLTPAGPDTQQNKPSRVNTKPRTGDGQQIMIDYSVCLLTNPMNGSEAPKAYGKNQIREVWNLEKFSKHIADHNGVYSRGTVKGVISDMCECLVEQLLNGNKIKLGELGDFSISLKTSGADSLDKFTAANIKAVNIVFTPGEDFENIIDRAEFNPVTSRKTQAAALKAEKAGATTVDISKKDANTDAA